MIPITSIFFSAVQLVCDKNWWRYHDNKWMAMFALQSTQSKEEKIRNIVTLLSEIAFYCFFSNNCLIIFCILLWIKKNFANQIAKKKW